MGIYAYGVDCLIDWLIDLVNCLEVKLCFVISLLVITYLHFFLFKKKSFN